MQPRTYEVRVSGLVPPDLVEGLDVAEVSTEPVRTVIRTTPSDQPALLGLLERLRVLGVELLEVRQLSEDVALAEPPTDEPAPTGSASAGSVPTP